MITKEQIEKIAKIITRTFNKLTFILAGANALTKEQISELIGSGNANEIPQDLFKDAFLIGKMRKRVEDYKTFRESLIGSYYTPFDEQSIKQINDSVGIYLGNVRDRLQHKILAEVLEANKNHATKTLGSPLNYEPVDVKKLIQEIRDTTQDQVYDWERTVVTELGNSHNVGSLHRILQDAHTDGENIDDILVYFTGSLDAATCQYCRKFFHSGNSYKVYRLKDILANGTNIGKKPQDWLPTSTLVHPRCRHSMVQLPSGWTLDDNGIPKFVHPDHHELNNNMKKKGDE